jgi:hypothetical protein
MDRYHSTDSILSFKLVKEGDLTCWVLKSNPMKNFSVSPSSSDIIFFLVEFVEMKMYSRILLFAFYREGGYQMSVFRKMNMFTLCIAKGFMFITLHRYRYRVSDPDPDPHGPALI